MKNNYYLLGHMAIFIFMVIFLLLLFKGTPQQDEIKSVVMETPEEREMSFKMDSLAQVEKYNKEALEMVPLTNDETPELIKYRSDLAQWLSWNDECMGMDPKSKPKDPRTNN